MSMSKKSLFVAHTYPYLKTPPSPNLAPFPGGTASFLSSKKTKQINRGNSIENITHITLRSIKTPMQYSKDPSEKPKIQYTIIYLRHQSILKPK